MDDAVGGFENRNNVGVGRVRSAVLEGSRDPVVPRSKPVEHASAWERAITSAGEPQVVRRGRTPKLSCQLDESTDHGRVVHRGVKRVWFEACLKYSVAVLGPMLRHRVLRDTGEAHEAAAPEWPTAVRRCRAANRLEDLLLGCHDHILFHRRPVRRPPASRSRATPALWLMLPPRSPRRTPVLPRRLRGACRASTAARRTTEASRRAVVRPRSRFRAPTARVSRSA